MRKIALFLLIVVMMSLPVFSQSISNGKTKITMYDSSFSKEVERYEILRYGSIYLEIANLKDTNDLIDVMAFFSNSNIKIIGIYEIYDKRITIEKMSPTCTASIDVNGTSQMCSYSKKSIDKYVDGYISIFSDSNSVLEMNKGQSTKISVPSHDKKRVRIDVLILPGESSKFDIVTKDYENVQMILDPWLSSNWTYRKRINITNNGNNLTNYSLKITFNTTPLYEAGKLNSTCKDIRVTYYNDSTGNETLIPYWLENCTVNSNLTNSTIWVRVPWIRNSLSYNDTIYIYYGNSIADRAENITNTFLNGSDFETNTSETWTDSPPDVIPYNASSPRMSGKNNWSFVLNSTVSTAFTSCQGVSPSKYLNNATIIEFFMTFSHNATGGYIQQIDNNTGEGDSEIYVDSSYPNNTYWGYYNRSGTKWYNTTVMTANYTWHKVVLYYNLTNLNETMYANGTQVYSILNGSLVTYNASLFCFRKSGAAGHWAVIDDAFVREWVYPEPTYIVDDEINYTTATGGTRTNVVVKAYDEDTLEQVPFEMLMINTLNNYTQALVTAYNNGSSCLYDSDTLTTCHTLTAGNQSLGPIGIDYNYATFRYSYNGTLSACPGPSLLAELMVTMENGSNYTVDSDSYSCGGGVTYFSVNTTVGINNTNGSFSKVANITYVTTGNNFQVNISEFRMLTPYNYTDSKTINITLNITNSTNNTNYYTYFKGAEDINDMTGYYTVSTTRFYNKMIGTDTTQIIAYLLKYQDNNFLQYFSIIDLNSQPIQNVTVWLYRYYSGVETLVAQAISNPAGSASIFVNPVQTYKILFSSPGYTDKQQTSTSFTGLPNPLITYLYSANIISNITFNSLTKQMPMYVDNISRNYSPQYEMIQWNGDTKYVNITYFDYRGYTNNVTLNMSYSSYLYNYSNSTLVTNTTRPNNITLTTALPLVNARYKFYFCIARNETPITPAGTYCEEAYYTYYNVSSWMGTINAKVADSAGGLSTIFWKLVLLFLMIAFTAVAYGAVGQYAIIIPLFFFILGGMFSILDLKETILLCILNFIIAIGIVRRS